MVSKLKIVVDSYINDGLIYSQYVFKEDGTEIRMARIWERAQHVRPTGEGKLDKILSYDNGYTTSNITDMRVCGDKQMARLKLRSGRSLPIGLDASLITPNGPVRVRELGVGTKLVAVDCYKHYRGDMIKLSTHGNARVRALLRNHGVPFTVSKYDGTITDNWDLYCYNFETPGVVVEGRKVTYGLNNYREGIKQLLGLPDSTTDEVVAIEPIRYGKYALAMYLDGPQNIVLDNGLIIQSTQTPVRHDR